MKIGRLDKRITIQSSQETRIPGGKIEEVWTELVTVWASIEPLRGREFFAAAAVNAEETIRIRIRYRQGITSGMRIVYGLRTFLITSPPIDPFEKHKELELMCKEVTAGG